MTLIDRLLRLSALWAAASDRSTARLATIVANDGKILDRLEGGATCTVATYERFLGFFRESTNWPGDQIPAEAQELLGEMEAIALPVRASPGELDEKSGRLVA